MRDFVYSANPARVVFRDGALAQLPEEVDLLGASRCLVLATPQQAEQAEQVAGLLGGRAVGVHAEAVMHVPVETARDGIAKAEALNADCYVAVGGGSTIGLGKIIARETGLPVIAVPTTYAGSEMTPIWGLTEDGVKKTGRDPRVLPRTVIYDPSLLATLPVAVATTSGMNAIAHSVEALYAENANPIISLIAEESIRALGAALPRIVADPADQEARAEALYGAWLAGMCLGSVGMALHHKLCHTLGGSFNLPHAEVHTVVIPYATAYNEPVSAELGRAARALGAEKAGQGLFDLSMKLGNPLALKDIGMPADGLDRAADIATKNPYYNPRPVTRDAIRALLEDAYEGRRPA